MSSSQLTSIREKAISFGVGARATSTALTLDENMSPGAWRQVLGRILKLSDSSAWWIGDALVHGEWRYGEKYREALETLEVDYDRARDYAYVAGNVPASVRLKDLSFYHHRVVAKLVPADQARWLTKAREDGWSVRKLRDELEAELLEPAGRPAVLEQLRFTIDPDRLERYTAAAERVESSVQDWAIAVLDIAAADAS